MGENVSGVAIRRQQQDAFGEVVEATDIRQTGRRRYEVENRTTAIGILPSGDDAGRLVQYDPLERRRRRGKWHPIDGNAVGRWVTPFVRYARRYH